MNYISILRNVSEKKDKARQDSLRNMLKGEDIDF